MVRRLQRATRRCALPPGLGARRNLVGGVFMRFALMALAAALGAVPALAQSQTAAPAAQAQAAQPTRVRFTGTVTAVSPTQMTVRAADGTSTIMGFTPGWL